MQADATEITTERDPVARRRVRLLTLEHLDGRTRAARRVRDLQAGLESDLGGHDRMTTGQLELAKRAAVLGALLEDAEARWAAGEPIELGEYLAAVNAQRRELATLGLERRARDVTPSLSQYLAAKAAAEPTRGDDEEEPA